LIFNKIQYTIFFLITMDFKRVLSTKTNVKQQNECHRLFKVDSKFILKYGLPVLHSITWSCELY